MTEMMSRYPLPSDMGFKQECLARGIAIILCEVVIVVNRRLKIGDRAADGTDNHPIDAIPMDEKEEVEVEEDEIAKMHIDDLSHLVRSSSWLSYIQ